MSVNRNDYRKYQMTSDQKRSSHSHSSWQFQYAHWQYQLAHLLWQLWPYSTANILFNAETVERSEEIHRTPWESARSQDRSWRLSRWSWSRTKTVSSALLTMTSSLSKKWFTIIFDFLVGLAREGRHWKPVSPWATPLPQALCLVFKMGLLIWLIYMYYN